MKSSQNSTRRRGIVTFVVATIACMAIAVGGLLAATSPHGRGFSRAPNAAAPQGTQAVGTNHVARDTSSATSATVLVYLNGSDLESYAGLASEDINEMIASGAGENVNVVIETLGTREWQGHGIASDHTQRYVIRNGELELVDDTLGQLDTTSADTLSDFISWGVASYPADRYLLVMWDHGAGPVYGFGYDEFQSDYAALTLDEIQQALKNNADVHFDFIGMDCCLMSSLETCQAIQPFCDYAILSEDFEPGVGWTYKNWLHMLEQNPGILTTELGTAIVDDMVAETAKDEENGDATLALIDESAIPALFDAWTNFAYANEDALLGTNYSHELTWRAMLRPGHNGFGHGDGMDYGYGYGAQDDMGFGNDTEYGMDSWDFGYWDSDMSYVTMTDYFVTDIMEVASSVQSDEATALAAAFRNAIAHYACTDGDKNMSGIGITLPYGDAEFYDQLKEVFTGCGIDGNYVTWLEKFVSSQGADNAAKTETQGTPEIGTPWGGNAPEWDNQWTGAPMDWGQQTGDMRMAA